VVGVAEAEHHDVLVAEQRASALATVLQAALSPVASSVGTDLIPAIRAPLDTMVHWDPVGGRFGGDQDLPARPSAPSSPRWQGMRQARCRRRVGRPMVAVSSWAVKWQGMAHSLPQSGPSLVEMVFPKTRATRHGQSVSRGC
jgi:hypothetical protein